MRVYCSIACIVAGLLLVSCAERSTAKQKPVVATVDQILASPQRFDGAHVKLEGFLLQPMLGDIMLFQTEPDYHSYRPEAGVRLAVDPNKQNLAPLQLKKCVVEGTFHASRKPGERNWVDGVMSIRPAP